MLRTLRRPDGSPSLGVRLLAALVVLGLVVLTAPRVLTPVLDLLTSL
ncbi:hypothetical protein [Vallicoccus soli]|nr:hypothetical protein [Vallicoccus soli]